MYSNNVEHLVTKTITTLQHFATLNLDLLIIRNDHFHEIDIYRKPTTNDLTYNNYTTILLNLNWQLMPISEIIGIRLENHTIHLNAPCGKKHKFPFMSVQVVKYTVLGIINQRASVLLWKISFPKF